MSEKNFVAKKVFQRGKSGRQNKVPEDTKKPSETGIGQKNYKLQTLEMRQRTLMPWWRPSPPAQSGWLVCQRGGKG